MAFPYPLVKSLKYLTLIIVVSFLNLNELSLTGPIKFFSRSGHYNQADRIY